MRLFDWFKERLQNFKYARMLNGGVPIFSQFGENIYASDVVQQAIYSIVTEMKKLRPQHIIKNGQDVTPKQGNIQAVLENPNPLMTSSELIEKIIWQLFMNYNAFVLPIYDNGTLTALYPVNPSRVDFLQDESGKLFIQFSFSGGKQSEPIPYEWVIHLRYRYSINEYMGGNESGQPDNAALLQTLSLNDTLLQGVAKALKSSFAVNGVVKYGSIVSKEAAEAAVAQLETQLKNSESGLMALDMKGEFIPFTRQIQLVDEATLKFIDSKILRHFGVPLPILTGDYTSEQLAAFYQKTLEPLIISIGQAFTKTLFTPRERAFGNAIEFYAEELIFMNTQQKLEFVRLLGDSGTLYENEKRRIFGLNPLPELAGVRLQSLNYVNVEIASQYQLEGVKAQNKQEEKKDEQGET